MTSLGCALMPPQVPNAGFEWGRGFDVHTPQDMAMMRRVLPKQVDVNLGERDLQEPQPWEKEAKTQSLFGVISWSILPWGHPHGHGETESPPSCWPWWP